jgi:hypothetical protein
MRCDDMKAAGAPTDFRSGGGGRKTTPRDTPRCSAGDGGIFCGRGELSRTAEKPAADTAAERPAPPADCLRARADERKQGHVRAAGGLVGPPAFRQSSGVVGGASAQEARAGDKHAAARKAAQHSIP